MSLDEQFYVCQAQSHAGLLSGRCFAAIEALEYMFQVARRYAVAVIPDMKFGIAAVL